MLSKRIAQTLARRRFGTMAGQQAMTDDGKLLWENDDNMGILLTLEDTGKPGVLNDALSVFQKYGINMTSIQSKPPKHIRSGKKEISFHISFNGRDSDPPVEQALAALKSMAVKDGLVTLGSKDVPWFPTRIEDYDNVGNKVLVLGDGILDVDHPSFRDPVYRDRRVYIGSLAAQYKIHDPIPYLKYNQNENDTWHYCYNKLRDSYRKNACREFNESIEEFERTQIMSKNEVPQLEPISAFLKAKNGWRLKPVFGLLSQREFLNGLAFKVFHSTQFIRHHTMPDYTPEPDIVHELMGHAPMLAVDDFADFSHSIGLASLGASEIELKRLAQIYWFTIEFGLCREEDGVKVYGAGILSSSKEIEYAVSDVPKKYPLDLFEIAQNHMYNEISDLQPYYFVAESFKHAKQQVTDYVDAMYKPFNVSFNEQDKTVVVDRRVKTRQEKKRP